MSLAIRKNMLRPRALDCIYLRPSSIIKGKHELYHIATRKVMTCTYCTPAYLTTTIINKTQQALISDNMPSGLQSITNNTDNLLAGVDSNTDINSYERSNKMESYHEDTLDTNQEILYKPNYFNVPNTTNKLMSHQENTNTTVNDSQITQQQDMVPHRNMENKMQQPLYYNINNELTDNNKNELNTILNINNNENDNPEIKKEFESFLAETNNENNVINKLPEQNGNESEIKVNNKDTHKNNIYESGKVKRRKSDPDNQIGIITISSTNNLKRR